MLRRMLSTATTKKSNFWVPYFGHCPSRTHGGPGSSFLNCIWIWVEVLSHHCDLQAENCVSARLCQLCAWRALDFPLQFLFRLAPNRNSVYGFTPFQSSHLNCQRWSKCLDGHAAGSVGMWKGDGSFCNEDIFSTISALCRAFQLRQFTCFSCLWGLNESCLKMFTFARFMWYDPQEKHGCVRVTKRFCNVTMLGQILPKTLRKNPVSESLPFVCFEVMPGYAGLTFDQPHPFGADHCFLQAEDCVEGLVLAREI